MVFVAEDNTIAVADMIPVFLPVEFFEILTRSAKITFSLPSILNEFLERLSKSPTAINLEHNSTIESAISIQATAELLEIIHVVLFRLLVEIWKMIIRLSFVLEDKGQYIFLLGRLSKEFKSSFSFTINN